VIEYILKQVINIRRNYIMKRAVVLFLVIIGLLSILALNGCSRDNSNNDNSDSGQTLTIDKKYILSTETSLTEDNQKYYIFFYNNYVPLKLCP